MAFFNRNPNEEAYIGGKKHWTDVIKNSASGELLIWRQPEEDFNTNSTLVVMPGEKAVFIKGGVVERINFQQKTILLSAGFEMRFPEVSVLSTVSFILSEMQRAEKFYGGQTVQSAYAIRFLIL